MSAADLAGSRVPAADQPPARSGWWPSGRLLAWELRLIFQRRRNLAGLGVLAAVPIVIAVAVRVTDPAPGSGRGPEFFSSITGNGFFVGLAALTVTLPLFLPLAVATIAGDTIAGEANVGTLRYLLAVPVNRVRLLLWKYVAVAIFAVVATLLVAVVGVIAGLALFGGGPVTLLSGDQVGMGPALLRLLAVCGFIAAGLCAVGAVGLFVSTLTEQPIGATITVVVFVLLSFVLGSIPQLAWLHPYLLTAYWTDYGELLRQPVQASELVPGLLSAAAYTVVFWSAGWARFCGRDLTS